MIENNLSQLEIYRSGIRKRTVMCGVSQGSVLGFIKVLLYINDLNQASQFVLDLHLCFPSIKKLSNFANSNSYSSILFTEETLYVG